MNRIQPIFILSLPRTGSTLLQRLLSSHAAISTTPEPWLLLPFLHPLASDGAGAEYSYSTLRLAQQEMFKLLPNGQADYFEAVQKAALHIYGQLSHPDSIYFLDKTPRYHLISEQVFQTFPNAKYILLWRNPLAVAASMLEFRPPWNLYDWYIDLYQGFNNLYAFAIEHQDQILSVRYEDLILETDKTLGGIFDYLCLEYPSMKPAPGSIAGISQLGDKKGLEKYSDTIGRASLDQWISVMHNPIRRSWACRYLDFIGSERLLKIGYDLADLDRSLSSVPISLKDAHIDAFKLIYGYLHTILNMSLIRAKINKINKGFIVYPYS
ncbi:sulfotransferase [Candidatus Villigracilis saccharophilus]|uniref:sulfotransferase family protein n=1 Tax=Candidatus Villigracilis saccharophilus TaxID=3140684 RepID=UPI003135FB53|nr:sulfotransferase [Anaerolineales bacterium]